MMMMMTTTMMMMMTMMMLMMVIRERDHAYSDIRIVLCRPSVWLSAVSVRAELAGLLIAVSIGVMGVAARCSC